MASLDGNLYRCRVRNAYGTKFSNAAELTITTVPPAVSASCVCASTSGVYCDGITGCTAVPPCTPGFSPCQTTYFTPNPIDCPGCGSGLILTNVRGNCSDLIPGHNYKVTIHFFGLAVPPSTQDVDIIFTASAPIESTSYVAMPTPDALTPTWVVSGIDIVEL